MDADGILGTSRLKKMQYGPGLVASTGLDLAPFFSPTIKHPQTHVPSDEIAGTLDYFVHSGRCGFATDRVGAVTGMQASRHGVASWSDRRCEGIAVA
jgi:hypothetical protein